MNRRAIDPDVKARALADIELGMSISEAARKHRVARQSIQQWRDQMGNVPAALQEKRIVLGKRVAHFLDEGFETLIDHARKARDADWFFKQNAADIAVYDGVIYDKMAHLIGSLREADEDEEADDDGIPVDIS